MKPKVKPIRDLYFRFIEKTEFDGRVNAQDVATALARDGLIELVPHRSKPTLEHYRELEPFASLNRREQILAVYNALTKGAK